MTAEPMKWAETDPGLIWRSVDGRYVIVAQVLPENPPRTVYQARKIDERMAMAYPGRGDLGYQLGESPWCWNSENSVHSAEAIIDRDAFRMAHKHDVPDDFPAVTLRRFYWPISDGTSRAALALIWRDAQLVVQIVGMTREDDTGYVPSVWTEINLSELGLTVEMPDTVVTKVDHGVACPACNVEPGEGHRASCGIARCRATGRQRLQCELFGESPSAGLEAVMTSSQADFERYFKTPLEHECGEDIWTGRR